MWENWTVIFRSIAEGLLPRFDTATQDEVRQVLRLLRPHAAEGVAKARYGNRHDGGYVMLDDFAGIDAALSLGIGGDVSWDLAVADRGATVYQFDHTVNSPPAIDFRLVFEKKRITAQRGWNRESLEALIEAHDQGKIEPNILLKMDIENDEWHVFDATPPEALMRLSQIAVEFHYLRRLVQPHWRELYSRVFAKLADTFAVVHVHGNNCSEFVNLANVMIPDTIEVTFANVHRYVIGETDEIFPGPLDFPNNPNCPDLFLGNFRFG